MKRQQILVDLVQHDTDANEQPEMYVTLQWCFIHQALRTHSKANLIRGKYGARYSVHHNL